MTTPRKYEFTGQTKQHLGRTLHRIRAVVSFGIIAAGTVGGWIETEGNLSHEGNAWVSGNAQVYGYARVYGDAQVYGYVQVYGNSQVYGYAQVYDNAQVSGYARVYGDAQVYGYVQVYGNSQVSGDAQVYGNSQVSGDAQVYDNAQVSRTPKCLSGFAHAVTVTDHHVAAGCQMHPPSVWRDRGAAIIRAEGFRDEALAWAAIINAIAEAHGCVDAPADAEDEA